jgi:hypothetical protein
MFTVNDATLGGSGTIGGFTGTGGLTVAPGNSIGTLTSNGNVAFGPASTFEVEANAAGQADKLVVKGTVNLTGSVLRVLAASGNYALSTSYLIIDNDGADPVAGTFGQVTTNLAFLEPLVFYDGGDGNDVVLTLINSGINLCSMANTRNQCHVALALDQFPTDNALFQAVLLHSPEGAREAFDALSGEVHASVSGVLTDESRYVRDAMLGRLTQAGYTGRSGQVASLGAGGPQVAALDAQAMTVGSDEPMTLWGMTTNRSPRRSHMGRPSCSGPTPSGPGQTSTATRMPLPPTAISAASSPAWTRMSRALGERDLPPGRPSPTSRSMRATAGQTWIASISAATPEALLARLHSAAAGLGPGTTSTPRAP